AQPTFQGLGRVNSFVVPGNFAIPGNFAAISQAFDVSADGLVVVGESKDASGRFGAFRWTPAGGMQGVPYSSYYVTQTMAGAVGVSPDGQVLVGNTFTSYYSSPGSWRPYRWRVGDSGVTLLPSIIQLAPSPEYNMLGPAVARGIAGDSA